MKNVVLRKIGVSHTGSIDHVPTKLEKLSRDLRSSTCHLIPIFILD